jgi:hypothetical protein
MKLTNQQHKQTVYTNTFTIESYYQQFKLNDGGKDHEISQRRI